MHKVMTFEVSEERGNMGMEGAGSERRECGSRAKGGIQIQMKGAGIQMKAGGSQRKGAVSREHRGGSRRLRKSKREKKGSGRGSFGREREKI